jgi:hypothetical protein
MAEYTFHPSRSQLGDTVQCQASAERPGDVAQMLRGHDGLVHAVIRREGSGALTYEEALQAGRIGLWRAIPSTGSGQAWATMRGAARPSRRMPG